MLASAKLKYQYLGTGSVVTRMTSLVAAKKALSQSTLLCLVFIGLNILDAWLTAVALGAGNYELNPFLGMSFGSSMLFKGLISVGIATALVLFRRCRLLKPLCLVMSLICVWNCVVVLFWS
jgi:hypothetical protein